MDKSVSLVDSTLGTDSDGYILWDAWGGMVKEVGSGGWSSPRQMFTVTGEELDEIRDSRKYATLKAQIAADPRPFVWGDDMLTRKYVAADFVGVLDVPHLVIRPSENTGLVHGEYAMIEKFFKEYSA